MRQWKWNLKWPWTDREFHNWAWISVGKSWRVGFSMGDPTAFGWMIREPNYWAFSVPSTNYYLSAYRRSR